MFSNGFVLYVAVDTKERILLQLKLIQSHAFLDHNDYALESLREAGFLIKRSKIHCGPRLTTSKPSLFQFKVNFFWMGSWVMYNTSFVQ